MLITFSIVTFFIGLSVFFFYRSENIQRKLNSIQKEIKNTNKSNQKLIDTMAMITSKNGEFALIRLNQIKTNNPEATDTINLLSPLIKNYSLIMRELVKTKAQLQPIVKKCYDGIDKKLYSDFSSYLNKQDITIKRMWSANNVASYISLVEALIVLNETTMLDIEDENKKAG